MIVRAVRALVAGGTCGWWCVACTVRHLTRMPRKGRVNLELRHIYVHCLFVLVRRVKRASRCIASTLSLARP